MDEVFKSEIHYQDHTGTLTHKTTQPTEDLILARNAELRKNPGSLNDLGQGEEGGSWGRLMCTIPLALVQWCKAQGHDLMAIDKDQADRNLAWFMATPQGKSCLVQAPDKRQFRGH